MNLVLLYREPHTLGLAMCSSLFLIRAFESACFRTQGIAGKTEFLPLQEAKFYYGTWRWSEGRTYPMLLIVWRIMEWKTGIDGLKTRLFLLYWPHRNFRLLFRISPSSFRKRSFQVWPPRESPASLPPTLTTKFMKNKAKYKKGTEIWTWCFQHD